MFYALYPERIKSSYSYAHKKDDYKSGERRMSFHCSPKGTLEIRIFPLVEDIDDLLWRTELLRFILEFKNSDVQGVFNEIFIKENSYLYNHLKLRFTSRKILSIGKLFSKFAKELDNITVISSLGN